MIVKMNPNPLPTPNKPTTPSNPTSQDNLITMILNLTAFLPYYFSLHEMLRTLFSPWKNIRMEKTEKGFSWQEFSGRVGANLVSRMVGFMMRSGVLGTYCFLQIGFVFFLPFFVVCYLLIKPFLIAKKSIGPSLDEIKETERVKFLKSHVIDNKNAASASQWFELIWMQNEKNRLPWWSMEKLLSIPPLGRDWVAGYTPTLDKYSTELTVPHSHWPHLIDRKDEIMAIQQALSRSSDANALIVGEEGVGKHTIVEGLAKMIYEGKCLPQLQYKRLIKIDIPRLISDISDYTNRTQTLKRVFLESEKAGNIILFIDDLDRYTSSGTDRVDFSSVIAEFSKSHLLTFVAITSPFAFQKYIFPVGELVQVFERVDVKEIDLEKTRLILFDIASTLESRHHIILTYEAIMTCVEKSDQFISDIPQPEKSISLLDSACVEATTISKTDIITPEIILSTLAKKTHVPTSVDDTMKEKLLSLEVNLAKRVIFQDEALKTVASALRKAFVVASNKAKPLASFLFLGPTGVGKTETAKAICQQFFGSDKHLIRFDMSSYQSKSDISKLLGSSESGEPGLLSRAIREQAYGVLLLDELEKASSDILNLFLPTLDEGYFTDGFGKRVDCRNLIIIATSNAAADFIFSQIQADPNIQLGEKLLSHVVENHIFSPEFINRFDGVITFRPLTKEAIVAVAKNIIYRFQKDLLATHDLTLTVSDKLIENLATNSYDPRFGARNMQRLLRENIEDKVAQAILSGNIPADKVIRFE